MFGGQVEGHFFNDLLAFDLNALQNSGNQWEFLVRNSDEAGPQAGPAPPARTNHTIISYNDQLYLFGGTNGQQWFNDVWTFDPRTNIWTQQDCIGYIPAPREGHAAALVNDVMYIFGGRTEEGTDLGDLAAFRISSKRWYTFQNMGPSPSPRSGHSMTAYGKQVVVLAGEPSSAPRDPGELSLVYVLDTGKIRYPNDQSAQQTSDRQSLAQRRPSGEQKSAIPTSIRSASREGQAASPDPVKRSESRARDNNPPSAPSASRAAELSSTAPNSRLPRASMTQAPSGPPPQGQPPNPRQNGNMGPPSAPRSKTPTKDKPLGPPVETIRAASMEKGRDSPSMRESPRDAVVARLREGSPSSQGRRTPTGQTSKSAARAMEAGEAAPLVSGGPTRQRSLRSQRGQGSIDSTGDASLGRSLSSRAHHNHEDGDVRRSRSFMDGTQSPRITPHQEALMKELDAAKSKNVWLTSELALARKAGYQPSSATSPTLDTNNAEQFGEEDRPLIEALLTMRTELANMQQAIEQQADSAARRMAEVEHQRDAAISEAAYARAKLAAHGGSQRGTPQPDPTRDVEDDHQERSTDMSRRLALALAAQSEHKAKMDALTAEIQSEKRSRMLAEEAADSAHKRLDALDQGRNPMELESLRAELHRAQTLAREEAAQRAQSEERLKLLQVEHDDINSRHEEVTSRIKDHAASLGSLQAAVSSSTEKANLMERQLEQERAQREGLEAKLALLKSEHEERTAELENTSRRLRDAEELAESHAKEANAHREAFLNGLSKAATYSPIPSDRGAVDQKILILQQSAERAHALVKSNQEAADVASQKLRRAEERIAGLEAYQEQTSREALQLRRQLQIAMKEIQTHQQQTRDTKALLENHQRDASALAVQHSALKDLLGERGMNISDARKSPLLDATPGSNGSRFGTPEQGKLRELEQQLQHSLKAHEESKAVFESREQEADRAYREKLEQLENDFQSAVHYVKGTEKMLKRMKDELSKYKTQNTQLQTELDETRKNQNDIGQDPSKMSEWEAERAALQKSIEDMRSESRSQISVLESQIATIRSELTATRAERDQHASTHAELERNTRQVQSELSALKAENNMLETRALDAENKVTMLLDQVGQSVVNYRRQSHMAITPSNAPNGVGHKHQLSTSTTASASREGLENTSSDEPTSADNRGSLALDSLASELDALRSHWETTNRSYRLSNTFDFERTPTKENGGSDLTDSLASWRKKLDDEERHGTQQDTSTTGTASPTPVNIAVTEGGMI